MTQASANLLNYGKIEDLTGRHFDPVYAFLQVVPYMVTKARSDGQADAHSYRGFYVAGAAYAVNLSDRLAWTAVAGNLRREPKAKVCAEKKLVGRAQKQMTNMVGFVVLATSDRDEIRDVSGLPTPTLHFCNDCRRDIPDSHIVFPSTLVVTSGLTDDTNQCFTVGQITEMYGRSERGDIDQRLFRAQPGFRDWEQRLATYGALTGPEAAALPFEERQRLAQLAINREVSL